MIMQKYCVLVRPNCIILFSAVKVSGDIANLLHYLSAHPYHWLVEEDEFYVSPSNERKVL